MEIQENSSASSKHVQDDNEVNLKVLLKIGNRHHFQM